MSSWLCNVHAVPDQSTNTTAERLVEEMFARFGAPAELHSDQGQNFEAQVFGEVCRRLGVSKTRTTPLHPQSDRLVERFNCTLATQLAIFTSQHQRDWDRHLPLVLWSYWTAVQESSQCMPAAHMFGQELRTLVDLAQANSRVQQKRAYNTRCWGQAFLPGDKIWVYCPVRKKGVSPKLRSHWQGPREVVAWLSEVVYRVHVPGWRRMVVLHRDRLSPYRPLAPPAVGEGGDGSLPHPDQCDSPVSPRRPVRRRPGHLQDYVLGDGVVGDD
ncbi:hypothetical protein SKAU_G00002050 [Synaphobranchus kaupii]|uniref:Integrase catalytic domain-containing protein n=1 Tax=Synaphobranchus kaupii TaxID=118154 RepID=A0A9Q1GA30_SYNKA|nr:hypothetical protein SKAU_G00002050 [Synaphobranchus kaupii]